MRRNPRCLLLSEEISVIATISQMSEGKPITLSILNHMLSILGYFDFMSAMGTLDSLGIYGSNIAKLFFDKNEGDFQKFIELINLLRTDVPTIVETRKFLKI